MFECLFKRYIWFSSNLALITPPPATHICMVIKWLSSLFCLINRAWILCLLVLLWVDLYRMRGISLFFIILRLILFLLSNLTLMPSLNFWYCSKTTLESQNSVSNSLLQWIPPPATKGKYNCYGVYNWRCGYWHHWEKFKGADPHQAIVTKSSIREKYKRIEKTL